MLDNSVDFCQVFRLPPGGSTQQQVKESTAFVTAVTLTPEESLLILCQTGEEEETIMSGMSLETAKKKRDQKSLNVPHINVQ